MKDQRENFERAFSSHTSGCVRTCDCGRTFYDCENSYDWDKGELEKLQKDKKATPVEYSVGTLILDGKELCMDCDCWHERAGHIMAFMDRYDHQIAEWLTLEKKRKQRMADASPVVK